MTINFDTISENRIYKLISQIVTPRPIAWIVTEHSGAINIAPFSYFAPLSSAPAAVIVSIGHKKDGSPKDTLANILESKKATICMVDAAHLKSMVDSAEELPREKSEAEAFAIATERIDETFPPIVQGVEAALFCTYMQTVTIEGSETVPLILKVEGCFVKEGAINERFDVTLDNLARIGKGFAKTVTIAPPGP